MGRICALFCCPELIRWLNSFFEGSAGGRTSLARTYTIPACALSSPPDEYEGRTPMACSRAAARRRASNIRVLIFDTGITEFVGALVVGQSFRQTQH